MYTILYTTIEYISENYFENISASMNSVKIDERTEEERRRKSETEREKREREREREGNRKNTK